MKTISLILIAALCSCSVVEPGWEGTKQGVNTVVDTGEDVVSFVWTEGVYGIVTGTETLTTTVWGGGKDVVSSLVGTGENVVWGAYNFVADPFSGTEEE